MLFSRLSFNARQKIIIKIVQFSKYEYILLFTPIEFFTRINLYQYAFIAPSSKSQITHHYSLGTHKKFKLERYWNQKMGTETDIGREPFPFLESFEIIYLYSSKNR